MLMRNLFILVIAVLTVSCSDLLYRDMNENSIENTETVVEKISSVDSVLTINDASIVARLERYGETSTKSNDVKTVDEVITINNAEGNPIIYAVNFKEGGYTLVSATKKYYPILSHSEAGLFSEEMYNTGLAVLLDEYESSIDICEKQPKDSLVKIRALWNKYEKFEPKKVINTKSDALFDLVSSSISQWNAQGIQYYFLSEGCPNILTQEQYQNYVSLASVHGNLNYDYMQNSVILVQTTERHSSKGPLTTTAWEQKGIYNDKLHEQYKKDYYAGCVSIATGQIMAYHRYPTSYNWDNILNDNPIDVASFIYDVAHGVDTDFGIFGSSSDIDKAQSYLNSLGYTSQKITHDNGIVHNSLYQNKPVYMKGNRVSSSNELVGHAWVCDGYVYDATDVTVSLQVISFDEPLRYQTVGDTYTFTTAELSFYMNWGIGQYSSLHTTSGISSDWYDSDIQYIYGREDLVYITRP